MINILYIVPIFNYLITKIIAEINSHFYGRFSIFITTTTIKLIYRYRKIYFMLLLSGCASFGGPPVAEWQVMAIPKQHEQKHPSQASALVKSHKRSNDNAVITNGTGQFIGTQSHNENTESHNEEEGVTLNLVNLPVEEAAKIIVGDIIGEDFVIDPKLEAKVTVHTAQPVPKKHALELFKASLRVVGLSLVKSAGVFRIVPFDQANTSGAPISTDINTNEQKLLGEGGLVVQLKYVSASEMKRLLEPIAARGSIVKADDSRNLITLSGSAEDLTTIRDAISMFDIDTMRGMSFALVPIKSGDADMLAEELRNIFGSSNEGPMNGMIRFIGNKRLSSILVISPQQQYISRARAWIDRLDSRAQNTDKQFYTYRVQNRPAKELMSTLNSVFGFDNKAATIAPRLGGPTNSSTQNTSNTNQTTSGQPPTSPLGALSAAGPTGAPGGGTLAANGEVSGSGLPGGALGSSSGLSGLASLGVPGGTPERTGSTANSALSMDNDRYRIGVDEAKNALIIMAKSEDYRRLRSMIEVLDVLPNQVLIEATIAEVRLNDILRFGVRWYLQKNASNFGFSNTVPNIPFANTNAGTNLLGTNVNADFPGFGYALRNLNQQVTLNALNSISDVNIISTPSLTVLDNRDAILQVGDQIPVQTLQSVSAIGNTFNSVNYTNTGVILKLTPHISESGRVMLDLEQEVSNVDPTTPINSTTPKIQQRRVKTQVVINDNESLLLGGLVQNSRGISADQVPVAGDLPVLGNLFKDKTDLIDKSELIIMITPHVMRSVSEGQEITEEFKRKLLDISSRAITRPHDIEQSTRRAILDPWSHSSWRYDRESH